MAINLFIDSNQEELRSSLIKAHSKVNQKSLELERYKKEVADLMIMDKE